MLDQAEAIQCLVQLTGGPEKYFSGLMVESDDDLDLEIYIQRAFEDGKIKRDEANVLKLALMTGYASSRCKGMMAGHADINAALFTAYELGRVTEDQAAAGRLADVANLTSTEARRFLAQTLPPQSLQQAVTYLKDANRVNDMTSRFAMLRLASLMTEEKAGKYLNDKAVQGNVVKAIDLAHQNGDLSESRHLIATLFCHFNISEIEAIDIDRKPHVMGDVNEAIKETKIRIVMKQATVDRQDAFSYLGRTNPKDDVEQALQLFNEAQSGHLVFNSDNGDTRHPPNVTGNTHVIAVLGVSDETGLASPLEDGWMVSDFYLWKHVLRGMGKSQQWLTCESPSALLAKYGRSNRKITKDGNEIQVSWEEGYVHGDPFEERRVVLNDDLLPAAHDNLTVTPRGIALRDEFLRCVESTCRLAEAKNDPVLIMTFSHGDIEAAELGGLVIGLEPAPRNYSEYLSPNVFINIYMKTPKVHVSLFMASCHSGHWVVTPRFGVRRPTIMAGAHANEETFAWVPGTSQQHAGGVYTSAFLAELLKEPPEFPEDSDPAKVRAYGNLSRDILAEANRLCIPARREQLGTLFGSLPLFTTEGEDDWFYQRSSMQLHPYKENFDRLPTIPAPDPSPYRDKKYDYGPDHPVVKAWESRHSEAADPSFSDRTGGYGTTRRGIKSSTRILAQRYMSSFHGDDSSSNNIHLYNKIRQFFGGFIDHDIREIENLRSQLLYRIWMMQRANHYAQALNLNKLPPMHEWDGRVPDMSLASKYQNDNFSVINSARIFRRPDAADGSDWGRFYIIPIHYLAHAFAASGYGPDDVERLLKLMAERDRAVIKKGVTTIRGSKRSAGSISMLESMFGRKSKSPKKRHRQSLSSVGLMPEGESSKHGR
ncbi:MAG: hypothetical protein Q9225_000362 [Loekoesia sp. 1 TL-2023]